MCRATGYEHILLKREAESKDGRAAEKAGAEKTAELLTPWDILSEENGGVCVRAEQDGVSLFDLPELLKDAGMYSAGVV